MAKPEFIFTFQNSCDNVPVSTFTPSDNGGKQAFTVTGYTLSDYMDEGDYLSFSYSGNYYTYTIADITGNQITMSFDYNAAITNVNTFLQFSIKTAAHPYNFSLGRFQWDKDRENYFYRKKYTGTIKFKQPDFDYLLFASDDECCQVVFKIYKLCDTEYSLFYVADIMLTEGTWNLSQCTFESPISPLDKYNCIVSRLETEVNLYPPVEEGGTRQNFKYYGDDGLQDTPQWEFYVTPVAPLAPLSITTVSPDGGPNYTAMIGGSVTVDPVTGNPWTITYRNVKYITYEGDPISFIAPAVTGWTFVSDRRVDGKIIAKYAKLAGAANMSMSSYSNGSGGVCASDSTFAVVYDPINDNCISVKMYANTDHTLYGCVFLQEALETLTAPCSIIQEVTSDFFEMNPVGDTPGYSSGINYVTALESYVDHLVLSNLEDIVYSQSSSSGQSQALMYTFKQLMRDLNYMFNVYWFIDSSNRLRIEHDSWFIANSIIDVSGYSYNKHLKVFTYLKDDVPNRENFTFEFANSVDYVGTDIVYSNTCSAPVTLKRPTGITTDIEYIRKNLDGIFTGIFMGSTDASDVLKYDKGKITGIILQNMHLSWANLHHNYHLYGRILESGLLNYVLTSFTTWRKRKKQSNQKYIACCLTIPETIGTITTELGIGNVMRVTYIINTGVYEFDLEI